MRKTQGLSILKKVKKFAAGFLISVGLLSFGGVGGVFAQDIIKTGKFLANSLSLSAQSNVIDDLYNRIELGTTTQNAGIWAGVYGHGKYADNFNANGFGGMAGLDILSQSFMGGLFVRYGSNNLKEEDNKGTMDEIEFGIHGVFSGIYNTPINIKPKISIGLENYAVEIGKNIDFYSRSVKGGFEVEYAAQISDRTKLSPFIGIEGGLAMNRDINGADITIKSDTFLRAEAKAGLGLSGKLREMQNVLWHSRLYGIFLLSAEEPKYKISDNDGNESDAIGVKEESAQAVIALGLEYLTSKNLSMFLDGAIRSDFGKTTGWIGIAGISYKFGILTDFYIPSQEDEMEEELAKKQKAEKERAEKEKMAVSPDESGKDDKQLLQEAQERRKHLLQSFRLSAATFKTGSAVLSDKAKEDISKFAQTMKNYDYAKITVEGHTDSIGKQSSNKRLSINRAKSVYDELVKNGIPSDKIKYMGFGPAMPVSTNKTSAGRQQNRRVEILVE